jgi:penicillin amidase
MTDARRWLALAAGVLLSAALLYGLSTRLAGIPPLGTLLDPADGLYQTARQATATADSTTLRLPALEGPVTVVRDERGVPHIFAERDRDAIVALGYVVAQDRLFQMDFIARVASGRLAAALGEQAVSADRFLRRTGMEWGAQKNLRRIREQGGLEWRLLQWYTAGVNAYAGSLDRSELPFEFRLLGYEPMTYRPLQAMRVLQYMAYDLTYRSDDADYATLRQRLDSTAYQELYPNEPVGLYVPIVPPKESEGSQNSAQATAASPDAGPPAEGSFRRRAAASEASPTWAQAALDRLRAHHQQQERLDGTLAAGFEPGKGSNNWAVHAGRSATGAPILAGDMHLSLTLPSIWYEVHLATPSMNTYGVTVPGAPLPVEAFTDHVGWAFTNTGADQIDHLALELDSTRQRYRYEGGWRDLRQQIDTIAVNHGAPVVDTLHYSHHGPDGRPAARRHGPRWCRGATLGGPRLQPHAPGPLGHEPRHQPGGV